jgi:hypothetical protein
MFSASSKGRHYTASSSGSQEIRSSLLRLCDLLKPGDEINLTTWQQDGMIGGLVAPDPELVCGLLRVIAISGNNKWLGHVVRLEAGLWAGEASDSVRLAASDCKAALEIAHVREMAR